VRRWFVLYKNVLCSIFDGFEVTLGGKLHAKLMKHGLNPRMMPAQSLWCTQSLQKTNNTGNTETAVPAQRRNQHARRFYANNRPPLRHPQNRWILSAVLMSAAPAVLQKCLRQCFDGFEVTLGEATSCKPTELWNQYAKEACASHCSEVPTPFFFITKRPLRRK